MAKALAEGEHAQFNPARLADTDQLYSDFDRAVKLLPAKPGTTGKQ